MVADLKTNVEGRIREETARREVEAELQRGPRNPGVAACPPCCRPSGERGFALHAVNAPARLVAGDFYDFFFIDDHRLALVMADVSGKGIPAAIYMAVTRTKLRDFAAAGQDPARRSSPKSTAAWPRKTNGECSSPSSSATTTWSPAIGLRERRPQPAVPAANGRAAWRFSTPTGPLVAPFPDAVFHDAQCRLERDDLLLLFTDGVTEAGPAEDELFGEERLERLLRIVVVQPGRRYLPQSHPGGKRFQPRRPAGRRHGAGLEADLPAKAYPQPPVPSP